jgi:hypothetical protein
MTSTFEDAWSYLWCDQLKEGIRLAMAVLTFMIPLWVADAQIGTHYYAQSIRDGLQWAAVTCVVISQSLLGKASQVSFERVLGTLIGGSLAMAMLFSEKAGAVLSLLGLVCIFATFFGGKFKLDYGGKLCCVTYIIVCACVCQGPSAIVSQWLSRSLGICSGVACTMLLNISVFPRSAINKAMQEIRKSITHLRDMHESSWDIVMPLGDSSDADKVSEQRKMDSKACEKAYMSAITAMRVIEDSIPITEDESVLGSMFGQRIIFPRWHWLLTTNKDGSSSSSFPAQKCKSLVSALRRSYRSLWSLHMALDDDFGLDLTLAFIAKYSYSGLLDELRASMKAFLDELLAAFPTGYGEVNTCIKGKDPVGRGGLERYSQALTDLLELSDAYYHELMTTGRVDVTTKAPASSSIMNKEKPVVDHEEDATNVSITIQAQSSSRPDHVLPPPPDTPRAWQLSVAPSMATRCKGDGADMSSVEDGKTFEGQPVAIGSPLQARLRWYAARFAMQCLLREASELASAANDLLMDFPGREETDALRPSC